MKISLHWIKQFVDFDLTVEELSHRLTMAGLEVEDVQTVGGDTVMEFEITPNRADCLSMIGMAREISAVLNTKLKSPKITSRKAPSKTCDITIQAKDACPRYIGTLIEGVTVKPADKALTQPLQALGMRPINNAVDITNYSLWENGQPLHVFDYDKLEGGKIIIRFAKKGEKIVTLDGEERELDPSILVIADAKKPVAIAGVMGGKDTEVTAATKNILLESAYFDQVLIRRASRKLALSSDSSYRFERGVDYDGVERGAARAKDLLLDACGGKIAAASDVVAKKISTTGKSLTVDIDDVNHFLGAQLSESKCKSILTKLGFSIKTTKAKGLKVIPPGFRSDIHQFVDIVEEIGRVVGYDNLPATMPVVKVHNVPAGSGIAVKRKLREVLMGQGFSEVVTFAMVSKEEVARCGLSTDDLVLIANPLTLDQEVMRPSLIANHLKVAAGNINRNQKDLKLFEIGKTYSSSGEEDVLALTLTGSIKSDWRAPSGIADFYDLKGALESVCSSFRVEGMSFRPYAGPYLEEGQSAEIFKGKTQVGTLGKIDTDIVRAWGIKQSEDIWYAQLKYGLLKLSADNDHMIRKVSEFPEMTRDVSLAVSREIPYSKIIEITRKNGGRHLRKISFIEEYLGEKITSDQKGIVFSLHFQSDTSTLTEDVVNSAYDKVCTQLISELNAVKR